MTKEITAGSRAVGIVPASFEDVQRVAKQIVTAGMGSFGYKDTEIQKIAKASAQIMCGLELGVPPMQALSNIAIINGRPQVYGELAIALVLAQGFGFDSGITGEGDERVAWATVTRPDGTVRRATFSVDQAKQAGLWDVRPEVQKNAKGGGKYTAPNDSPWFKYPDDMLVWKATARVLKRGAADVMKGVVLREDMEGNNEPIDITPEPPVKDEDFPDPDAPPKALAEDSEKLPEPPEKVEDAETIEPMADEDGYIRMIEADIQIAMGDIPALDEVRAQYAEDFPRLSASGLETVEEMFEAAKATK